VDVAAGAAHPQLLAPTQVASHRLPPKAHGGTPYGVGASVVTGWGASFVTGSGGREQMIGSRMPQPAT
jgi:hypothetical protein